MNIMQINTAILQGGWTNEQLTSVIDAVKFARARLGDSNKRSITLGSQVQFNNSRTGHTMIGTVDKIAIKFVTVRTAQGLWKVPASMLTPVVAREYA